MAILRAIGWTIAGIGALCVGAVAVMIGVVWVTTSVQTEHRIKAALDGHYPGKRIHVQRRADWSYAHQICFDLVAVDPVSAARSRDTAMIGGDDDGGTWRFVRSYRSLDACKSDFSRG